MTLFIITFLGAVLIAYAIGVRNGKTVARTIVGGALILMVVSFGVYAFATNNAREHELFDWRRDAASWAAGISWLSLYTAAGACGPAFAANKMKAAGISMVAVLAAIFGGTYLIFTLACALAGQCL